MELDPIQRKLNKIDNEGIPQFLRNAGIGLFLCSIFIFCVWLRDFKFEAVGMVEHSETTCQADGRKCTTTLILNGGIEVKNLPKHENVIGKEFSKFKWQRQYRIGNYIGDYAHSPIPWIILFPLSLFMLRGWKKYKYKPE